MTKRIESVDGIIKREIADILLKTIDIGRDIFTTVTRVKTSTNIIQTKIFISVIPEKEFDRVMGILNRNIYQIQQKLNKRLNMRPVPKIIFIKEKQIKSADRVEELLNSLKKSQ